MTKYVAVTGACGFIGRALTRKLLEQGHMVYAVDALTYAADPTFPAQMLARYPDRFCFRCEDIRNLGRFPDIDVLIHLAAETHVDNSISDGQRFVDVNVNGTFHLLEMCRAMRNYEMPHLIYISTDEVYGPCESGVSRTTDPLKPSSPYSASKAAADLLVQAWGTTYGLRYTIIRPTNCYGVGQYPEKLIPKSVRSLMLGRTIPVHGNGEMTRSWLWVDDLADAILLVMHRASAVPPIVNVGGNTEASVRQVVKHITHCYTEGLDKPESVNFGYTRDGCDMRYAVDDSVLRDFGWKPTGDLWLDLPQIVAEERSRFRF